MIRIAGVQELSPGRCLVVMAEDQEIAVCQVGDAYHAIENSCPHQGGSLGEGPLEGTVLTCPWHGWPFDVTTGEMPGHGGIRVRRYSVVVQGDDIMVDLT